MNLPIVLLTNASAVYAGGEFFTLLLATELQQRNCRVIVSCSPGNLLRSKCEERRIPTAPIDFPSRGGLWRSVSGIKRIIKENGVQIVHTNTNYDRTAGAIAAFLTGAKHVANIHSYHSISHNLTHWIRNRYWTDHFITVGNCVRETLIDEDGIAPGRITTVHLGVNPEEMQSDAQLRQSTRRALNVGENQVLVGNVARLVPFKGHEYLLRAFSLVQGKHPEARLIVVGDGPLEMTLKQQAETLGISDRIIFAGFRDDIPALYSAMDVYIHSSVEGGGETFPFAVLQALAFGLPLVVTVVGEVGEMVESGVNGLGVVDRNDAALAEALSEVLSRSELRRMMGAKSRELSLRKFTLKQMADSILRVYRGVLPC